MEKHPSQTLEKLIHRELSKLPERPAPNTLIPQVLAQIQARANKHWWQRPWCLWPLSLQLASLPLLLASVSGTLLGISVLWNFVLTESDLGPVSNTLDSISAVWDFLGVLGNAVLVLGRAAGQEWMLLALLVPMIMYLACIGLGTLCYRMAVANR